MTRRPARRRAPERALACLILLCAALGATAAAADANPGFTLTVTASGTGSGVITSSPAGIDCGSGADAAGHSACTFQFDAAVTSVGLSAAPDARMGFGGFGGACSGTSCTVSLSASASVSATFDKPPIVTIAAPLNGHAYSASAVPTADFACAPDPGSTLRSCTGTLDDGSAVLSAAALPRATGLHTLTVTATDADGSAPTTATAAYTVNPPPACPDARATTNEGQSVGITLDCTDANATTVTDQIDLGPRHGTLALTSRGVRYTPTAGFAGTDSFTYHGVSANGASAAHTVTVLVLAPPVGPDRGACDGTGLHRRAVGAHAVQLRR